MRTIVLSFEYKCFPIWVYDDNYMVDYNDILDEWEEDKDLNTADILAKSREAQHLYDSGYIDDGRIFDFVGFKGDKEKLNRLNTLLDEIREFIKEHMPNGYVFEDRVANQDELKDF